MKKPFRTFFAVLGLLGSLLLVAAHFALGAEPVSEEIHRRFADEVQPFLKAYCRDYHNKEKQEAKLDHLSGYTSPLAVVKNPATWEEILVRLKGKEMPPEERIVEFYKSQPTDFNSHS